MKAQTLIPIVFLIFTILTPTLVHADTQIHPVIFLLGFRWNTYRITVQVPQQPSWAHNLTIEAMEVWNQAQAWFTDSYYPNHEKYRFVESENGKVKVVFVKEMNECGDCLGWARTDEIGGIARNSEVRILITANTHTSSSILSMAIMKKIMLHELGHVLGLGHAYSSSGSFISDDLDDLMNPHVEISSNTIPTFASISPSTLDLQGTELLAQSSFPPEVSLPPNIVLDIFHYPVVLEIVVPNNATITLDNSNYLGSVKFSKPIGTHDLSVSSIIYLSPESRMVFYGWRDWSELGGIVEQYSQSKLNLFTNLRLEAIYDMQNLLRIRYSDSSEYKSEWYNSEGNATFYVPVTSVPLSGIFGLLGGKRVFQGWFEAGNLVTTSPSGTVRMNGPHTIIARWTVDYTTPLAFMAVLIVGLVALASYKRLRLGRKSVVGGVTSTVERLNDPPKVNAEEKPN